MQMKNNPDLQQQIITLLEERTNQNFEAQVSEASRVVFEIDTIESRNAFELVKKRIEKPNRIIHFLHALSRAAAILFIPLLLSFLWLFNRQKNTSLTSTQFAMQEITSPLGVRSKVVLSDGSIVWLNAQSTLRFKVPFDSKNRNVELNGEAFFEVQKEGLKVIQAIAPKNKFLADYLPLFPSLKMDKSKFEETINEIINEHNRNVNQIMDQHRTLMEG